MTERIVWETYLETMYLLFKKHQHYIFETVYSCNYAEIAVWSLIMIQDLLTQEEPL